MPTRTRMLPGRTTGAQIVAIIETDVTIVGSDSAGYPGLDPFIDMANEMVTECCTLQGQGYSDNRLTMIETWLAAHYYALRDPRVFSEKAGSVAQSFQATLALGLNNTTYGQQAMRIDTAGGLAAKENKVAKMLDLKVGITWLGNRRSGVVTPPDA